MVVWLKQVYIYWGFNSVYKIVVLEGVNLDDIYSWWWGICCLFMGMFVLDSEMIVSDLFIIFDVEG